MRDADGLTAEHFLSKGDAFERDVVVDVAPDNPQ
jgi:hypothetical protein